MPNIIVLFLHKAIAWANCIFPSNLFFPVIETTTFVKN